MPFVSAVTGNPPVNAHVAAFCLRYFPFFMLHCGLLLFLGQRFLIPGGSKKGFWYRAGILWVAMWWDNFCAMLKGLRSRRVADRVVAAKWKPASTSPWHAVRPHIILATAALAAFLWTCLRTDRRETIWGTLLFLGLIFISQGFIIFKVTRPAKKTVPVDQPIRSAAPLPMPAAYSQQESKL